MSRPAAPAADRWLAGGAKRLLIDGSWTAAADGAEFDSVDPATGTRLASLARATAHDVDDAVAAARQAFIAPAWRGLTPSARGQLLWRIAEAIRANADELAQLETLDQGKTLATSRFAEIPGAVEQFRYYAGYATKITGTTFQPSISYQPAGRQVRASTVLQPVGVVAAIVPWNSPLLMACMKLAPALAAGCTVVLKPAEDTSLTAIRLGELMLEVGLPAGVVNILTGDGSVGAALAGHRDVQKVSFTGSTAVGKELIRGAADNLTRLTLELGGKSPAIVLADADLDLAVPGLARGIFANAGQVCVAGSRIYVADEIYGELERRLSEHARSLKVGHGLAAGTDLGPLINVRHARSVQAYLDEASELGTTIHCGGIHDGESAFFSPAVLSGAGAQSRLMQEEIFGPVAALTPFSDLEDVLTQANDSTYALAASVWTRDLASAHTVSEALEAGTVWVNCHSYFSPELVKGGHKQSGWGYENGLAGLEGYLESKTICTLI